jgi:hypothetical protein
MRTTTLMCDEVIMKMILYFSVEMLDYNQKFNFCPRFIMRNVLVMLIIKKFELIKMDKFVGIT